MGGQRWLLVMLGLALIARPALSVQWFLSKYDYEKGPALAALARSEAGLLSVVESEDLRNEFGLDWIPEELTSSPGSNALVDAAEAYAFLLANVEIFQIGGGFWKSLNGSFNTFGHNSALSAPNNVSSNAPNHDTVYSLGFLDLRQGPVVVTLPDQSDIKYWSVIVYDVDSNVAARLGSSYGDSQGGDYLFYWKGASGQLTPDALQGYAKVFALGQGVGVFLNRLLVSDPEVDLPLIKEAQSKTSIAFAPKHRPYVQGDLLPGFDANTIASPKILWGRYSWDPSGPSDVEASLNWFSLAGNILSQFQPLPAGLEEPLLSKFLRLGLTLDKGFDQAAISNLTVTALDYGITLATHVLHALSQNFGEIKHGNWQYSIRHGRYGQSDVWLRAVYAKWLPIPNLIEDAAYLVAFTDSDGAPLDGSGGVKYQVTVPAGLPLRPTGWWSLIPYNDINSLVPNPINRYTIGDRTTDLVKNDDGSITVTFAAEEPSDPTERANWLPIPSDRFYVVQRLYDALPDVTQGAYAFEPLEKVEA